MYTNQITHLSQKRRWIRSLIWQFSFMIKLSFISPVSVSEFLIFTSFFSSFWKKQTTPSKGVLTSFFSWSNSQSRLQLFKISLHFHEFFQLFNFFVYKSADCWSWRSCKSADDLGCWESCLRSARYTETWVQYYSVISWFANRESWKNSWKWGKKFVLQILTENFDVFRQFDYHNKKLCYVHSVLEKKYLNHL